MHDIQAIWTDGTLHLWGRRCGDDETGQPVQQPKTDHAGAGGTGGFLDIDELRREVGDVWDSLLASGAGASTLRLRMPHKDGRVVRASSSARAAGVGEGPPSPALTGGPNAADGSAATEVGASGRIVDADAAGAGEESGESTPTVATCTEVRAAGTDSGWVLETVSIATLSFSAADAVDLLTDTRAFAHLDGRCSGSLRYWSRVAHSVLELLAKQRFVPDLHHGSDGRYRGFWRVIVGDTECSDRLRALIVSMPPVCRALADRKHPVQAASLVENFLWCTVDALVRQCMEGDELAHALQEQATQRASVQARWLRSLVHSDPFLDADGEGIGEAWTLVQKWLSCLAPTQLERSFRTCLRLHAPGGESTTSEGNEDTGWRISVHVQALDDRSLVLDAKQLWEEHTIDPVVLQRPFDNACELVQADLERAARRFPPLERLAMDAGVWDCALTADEAYTFLRDALPMLDHEGFGVWIPNWWRKSRPRLGMQLRLRPADSAQGAPTSMGLDALVSYDWHVALDDDALTPDEISELARAKTPLVQLRGRWTEVQPADVEAAVKFLDKNRSGAMTVMEALRRCYVGEDTDTGLPVVGLRADGWIDDLINGSFINDKVRTLEPPKRFNGTLRPYQLKGLEWLHFLAKHGLGACLADDMGLGKTIQMIALLLQERQDGVEPGPTLLVVPMSLVGNWKREIERFGPSLKTMVHHGLDRLSGQAFVDEVARHDVVISTYGLIHRDLEHVSEIQWHRVALDEAQNIKNPAAKQSTSVRALRAVHRVALTGTPVENRLSELWSIIDFLNPGYLGSAGTFRRLFAVPIERHHDTERAEHLRRLIRPFVLRRLKSDPGILAELPAKLEMKVFCNLTSEQAALYEALVGDMLGQIEQSGGIKRRGLILATLVKLKQICNHPAHFLRDGGATPHRSGKCDRLAEMLEEVVAEGDRALVFTQFRVMGDLLKARLEEQLDCHVLFLHGGVSQKGRDAMVQRFQEADDAPVFILSLRAGGFGLNLTAANHVFHFDRWWNPAVEAQATDRAHRIGQSQQLQVHKFVCIGTLEERIDALLERKKHLAEKVLGTGEDWLTELSTEGLRDLFQLSREAVAEE
ncbi:MAG: DEAD/DEAH box helicase [Planctomycetes bacterium]|nr:DEAD/DEAH box helicase [Planctomycetota bacterium]